MQEIQHYLCLGLMALILVNAFSIMVFRRPTLLGLDRLAGMVVGGLLVGAGRLLFAGTIGFGHLADDGFRAIFRLPPRQRPRRRRRNNNEDED